MKKITMTAKKLLYEHFIHLLVSKKNVLLSDFLIHFEVPLTIMSTIQFIPNI